MQRWLISYASHTWKGQRICFAQPFVLNSSVASKLGSDFFSYWNLGSITKIEPV